MEFVRQVSHADLRVRALRARWMKRSSSTMHLTAGNKLTAENATVAKRVDERLVTRPAMTSLRDVEAPVEFSGGNRPSGLLSEFWIRGIFGEEVNNASPTEVSPDAVFLHEEGYIAKVDHVDGSRVNDLNQRVLLEELATELERWAPEQVGIPNPRLNALNMCSFNRRRSRGTYIRSPSSAGAKTVGESSASSLKWTCLVKLTQPGTYGVRAVTLECGNCAISPHTTAGNGSHAYAELSRLQRCQRHVPRRSRILRDVLVEMSEVQLRDRHTVHSVQLWPIPARRGAAISSWLHRTRSETLVPTDANDHQHLKFHV